MRKLQDSEYWEEERGLLADYGDVVPETKVPQLTRRQKLAAVWAYRAELAARMEAAMEEPRRETGVMFYKRKF